MSAVLSPRHVALIGEALIEFNGSPFAPVHQSMGGDTLNTAVYLARLIAPEIGVRYITAVGIDTLSDGMVQRWQAEGIDTTCVLRDPARLLGLYWVQVDEAGERSFLYWRSASAARHLLRHREFERAVAGLRDADLIYVSGISLAILPDADREKLLDLLRRLAAAGVPIAFDTNYRARLWQSTDAARTTIASLLPSTRLVFATWDDERTLWGDETVQSSLSRLNAAGAQSIVLKLGPAGCLYSDGTRVSEVKTCVVANVIDTTAAGDAFNAGFLAAWLRDSDPKNCCRVGNSLAGAVIQHAGAIIPAAATPSLEALLRSLEPEMCS